MTIFVDSAMIPARVGRISARWCHLMSDQIDPEELHRFAESIGLRRSWFQPGKHNPVHDHYDVTESKRAAAVRTGATVIDRDGLISLLSVRRAAVSGGHRD